MVFTVRSAAVASIPSTIGIFGVACAAVGPRGAKFFFRERAIAVGIETEESGGCVLDFLGGDHTVAIGIKGLDERWRALTVRWWAFRAFVPRLETC